jgi:hypothetical protein
MKIIDASPSPYNGVYASIDLRWWPILSISVSVLGILISFLKISGAISAEHGRWYGLTLFFPVFLFRIISWQFMVLLFAENIFWVLGISVLLNIVATCLTYKDEETLELRICYAIQSVIFPINKLIDKHDVRSSLKGVFWMCIVGNLMMMGILLLIYLLTLVDLFDPWNSKLVQPILVTKDWFEATVLFLIPVFLAATIPIVIEQAAPLLRLGFTIVICYSGRRVMGYLWDRKKLIPITNCS